MINIKLLERVGSFAENKDIARKIRIEEIIPALKKGQEIILDFSGIDAATQSFMHALISDLLRKFGNDVLEKIKFKSCSDNVQKIIMIVTEYMQEGL
jgi:hypothetical protein